MDIGPMPYLVHCPEHGKVYLTEEQYMHQLRQPDAKWKCPCGEEAWWDDDNYEEWLRFMEEGDEESEGDVQEAEEGSDKDPNEGSAVHGTNARSRPFWAGKVHPDGKES